MSAELVGSQLRASVNWPQHDLSYTELIGSPDYVPGARLRETIARVVYREGRELVRQVDPNPQTTIFARISPAFALQYGFRAVGETMVYACALAVRGIDVAERIVESMQEQSVATSAIDMDRAVYESVNAEGFRRWAPSMLREVEESFAIDPTGNDLLTRRLKANEDIAKHSGSSEERDRATGYRRGVERYRQLYAHAVRTGGEPDRNGLKPIHRGVIFLRRMAADIIDLPPRELYE